MGIFLADESVDFRIIDYLKNQGFSIETILNLSPSLPDEKVLSTANEMGAILLTEDKDFGQLTYRLKKKNHGIILIRLGGVSIDQKNIMIHSVLNSNNDLANNFTVISKDNIRMRKIPKPS